MRSVVVENVQQDLVEVDEYMSDNESIYSIVSIDQAYEESSDSEDDLSFAFMDQNQECPHEWDWQAGLDSNPFYKCSWFPSKKFRAKCTRCYVEACTSCLQQLGISPEEPPRRHDHFHTRINILERKAHTFEEEIKYLKDKIAELENGPYQDIDIGLHLAQPSLTPSTANLADPDPQHTLFSNAQNSVYNLL